MTRMLRELTNLFESRTLFKKVLVPLVTHGGMCCFDNRHRSIKISSENTDYGPT